MAFSEQSNTYGSNNYPSSVFGSQGKFFPLNFVDIRKFYLFVLIMKHGRSHLKGDSINRLDDKKKKTYITQTT